MSSFFLKSQQSLEDFYGVNIELNVDDFIQTHPNFTKLGELLIHQANRDLDIALMLDQDFYSACHTPSASSKVLFSAVTENDTEQTQDASAVTPEKLWLSYSVVFEEISHFVYLAYNHQRGRDITRMEMEIQSEIDRILLAFFGPRRNQSPTQSNQSPAGARASIEKQILEKLHRSQYSQKDYEFARLIARRFLSGLSHLEPDQWTKEDFTKIRKFFHSDLGEKQYLAR